MPDKIKLTIDNRPIEAEPGTTVLDAALAADIYIPHLCHHPDLDPVGVCRLCMVELEGARPAIACRTPVAQDMVIRTTGPQIDQIRRVSAELLIVNHRDDCLSCAQNNDCELQRIATYVGVDQDRLDRLRRTPAQRDIDTSNPFFELDHSKCVLCGICVRTCNDLQGVSAIDFNNRGFDTKVGTFGDRAITESVCESCGECVDRCPVGALAPKNYVQPTREVKTVCTYCGVGCGMHMGVRGDRVVNIRGDRDNPANRGSLCVKGRFGYSFIHHPDRLTTPLIRKDGELVEADWDKALDLVADRFAQHKGQAFAAMASAKCTNEENYLIQKLSRVVMGTNNVDHCARL